MSVHALNWALYEIDPETITPTQRIILVYLADRARKEDGLCWPSQTGIGRFSGIAREVVNRNLKDLEIKGFIFSTRNKDESGRDLPKTYRLNFAKTRGVTLNHTGETDSDLNRCDSESQGRVIKDHTNQNIEPKHKPETTTASVDVKNSGEGKEKEDGYTLLKGVGVNEGVSRALSKSHSVSRIREMIDLARSKNRSNTPGFIVTGLKEGWESGNRGSNIDDLIARFEARERGESHG